MMGEMIARRIQLASFVAPARRSRCASGEPAAVARVSTDSRRRDRRAPQSGIFLAEEQQANPDRLRVPGQRPHLRRDHTTATSCRMRTRDDPELPDLVRNRAANYRLLCVTASILWP